MSVTVKFSTREAKERFQRGGRKGIRRAMHHLHGESTKVVPIQEGTLERSAAVTIDEGAMEGAVSYDTVYAVRQHEELDWNHDPGRQAKYLEEPFVTETPTMLALIAADIRREMR